jgi:hypothetical protein
MRVRAHADVADRLQDQRPARQRRKPRDNGEQVGTGDQPLLHGGRERGSAAVLRPRL